MTNLADPPCPAPANDHDDLFCFPVPRNDLQALNQMLAGMHQEHQATGLLVRDPRQRRLWDHAQALCIYLRLRYFTPTVTEAEIAEARQRVLQHSLRLVALTTG